MEVNRVSSNLPFLDIVFDFYPCANLAVVFVPVPNALRTVFERADFRRPMPSFWLLLAPSTYPSSLCFDQSPDV